MEKLFQTVLYMSVTASLVILAVLLARLALRKAPKAFSYVLWAVVLFRLLCPFTIESRFSLVPDYPKLQGAASLVQAVASLYIPEAVPMETNNSAGSTYTGNALPYDPIPVQGEITPAPEPPSLTLIASVLWLAGVAVLLGHGAWSLAKLRRELVCSVQLEGESNVRLADHIPSPFVIGLLSPTIYLPSDLSESERDYILLHERTHIRRKDHITRALAWLALAVHWFNPLVWLAFRLAGQDMEMSCDEAVLRKMDRDVRTDYSNSLLRLSAGGKLPAGPLAFGGGDLKRRIKNVLSYQKPALRAAVVALVAVLTLGTALATTYGGFIDPAAVTAVTQIPCTGSVTPQHTVVYTAEDRRKDLLKPVTARELRRECGEELIKLINSYHKTVYGWGELELSGDEHRLYRMSCTDGGYYLVDHWYWNGVSFNPLHLGEDDYTTLVTRYDSEGNAGITWQMEYDFDYAFGDWSDGLMYAPPASPAEPAIPPASPAEPAIPTAPSEEEVLRVRERALEGMTPEQIKRLTETVKTANLCLEQEYMYNDLWGKLEDPKSLQWNYFHETGKIQIGWAYDGAYDMEAVCEQEELTEDEFYAKYGVPVIAYNDYDANAFIALLDSLNADIRNFDLYRELQCIKLDTQAAARTHEVEHVKNLYMRLHDLDYFLLRYGPSDVGPYVKDDSTVSKYYGTLSRLYR